jgi:hypothetical protein
MDNLRNKISTILHHPVFYITVIDVFFVTLCSALLYIVGETILPGIFTRIILPYTVFAIVFLILTIIVHLNKKRGLVFPLKKKSRFIFFCALFIFTVIMAIANYRFGILIGSAMTCATLIIMIIFASLYYDTLGD